MKTLRRLRATVGTLAVMTVWVHVAILSAQNPTKGEPKLETGEEIFLAACANCHGADGKGAARSSVVFDTRLPNFTDCSFATKEPDGDWSATIHNGGPARGFSPIMPSFREALTDEQIDKVIEHLRTFCTDKSWPRGDLNLPRAFATEKAFPENETVITSTFNAHGAPGVTNQVTYEKRIGAKNQIELVIPYNFTHEERSWVSGLGDMAFGYKRVLAHSTRSGSIFSVAGEVTLPTGDAEKATGKGNTIFETFAAYGQMLPWDSFVQVQSGVELPAHPDQIPKAWYLHFALGRSFTTGEGLGRAWTPQIEFVADRDFEKGAKTNWDVLPQLQIPISKRQHILAAVGARVPMNNTVGRGVQLMMYLLWDFADGTLKQGW